MAITINNLTPAEAGLALNAVSADASGGETLLAAPGAGKSIYLTQIEISCVAAITVTILDAAAVLLGPFNFAATSGSPVHLTFRGKGVRLTTNHALTLDASGAGAVQVFAEGYIK